jgi:hypothetical protein
LKAKYYSRGSILEAKVGSRPSLAWHSILAAKDLIQDGLIWRIGNGKSVRIWGGKWIPCPTTFSVQSPVFVLGENSTVSELFDREAGGWNVSLIRSIFERHEDDVICGLPMSRYNCPDRMIWRVTKTSDFTVQSAYFLEKERKVSEKGESSNRFGDDNYWRTLWGLKIPNAAKVFLWRACNNILPTKENLLRKGITKDGLCLICGQYTETVQHILWECISVEDVWGACKRIFQKSSVSRHYFSELFGGMIKRCGGDDLAVFAIIAWRIWHRRNGVLHGEGFIHPNQLVIDAEEFSRQFTEARVAAPQVSVTEAPAKWLAPAFGRYKVNWDIALGESQNRMGVGVIVRDY